MNKTRFEVERLKEKWLADPGYNIEEIEGYEEYKAELLAFRQKMELKWKEEHKEKVVKFAGEKGIDTIKHYKLANFLYSLESRTSRLEVGIDKLMEVLGYPK